MYSGGARRGGDFTRRIRTSAVGVACSAAIAVGLVLASSVADAYQKTNGGMRTPTEMPRVPVTIGWHGPPGGDAEIVVRQSVEPALLKIAAEQTGLLEEIGATGSDAAAVRKGGNPPVEPELERRQPVAPVSDSEPRIEPVAAGIDVERPIQERTVDDPTYIQESQFKLPKRSKKGEPPKQLMQRLTYEYGYGSQSEFTYRADPDLDNGVEDDSLILTPELNGFVTYRPTAWLDTTLEMILEREISVREEERLTLPDGDIQTAEKRELSLLVDQAFVTLKGFTDPFALSFGRRNFEDSRHWLYDTSLDGALVQLKLGKFRIDASAGRESWVDLDLFKPEKTNNINTYILHADYRGIEDIKLAGYAIYRDDRDNMEGQPLLLGVRSQGMASDRLSYWSELAFLRGEDEQSRNYSAYAFDIGGTYRFAGLPFNPNVTLGYAMGTGDSNPTDGTSREFRQTDIHSNETKFAGVSEFKVYGEALDPELSNLRILTAGLGFRPAHNISLDFVYHHYWLDEIADEIRGSALTAQMNQDDARPSKNVGNAFDVVVGFRSLFGIRRLGVDLRAGWFFPGRAFRADPAEDNFHSPDAGLSIVAKFWW